MIDPSNITNYNLTDNELEEHLLFWICAAGKNGTTAARCLDNLLSDLKAHFSPKFSPFQLVRLAYEFLDLPQWMKGSGIGCFNSKAKSFIQIANSGLNLKTCSTEDLEKIHGIGMKTSRCFILHSRKNAQCAGLDTHMLKFLKSKGIDVPRSTPNSKKQYLTLEKHVLYYAKMLGVPPADFDLGVWNGYSIQSNKRSTIKYD